jgi:hypothetical protein
MSDVVLYCEYEARMNTFRYMLVQNRLMNEAIMRWLREHKEVIDAAIGGIFLAWLLSLAIHYYSSYFPGQIDKKRIRSELVNVEHAIKALKDHRTCLIEKLKRD